MSANDQQVGGEHYVSMALQPWDVMEEWMSFDQFRGFLTGNVIKYVARYQSKNGIEDLKKAKHYMEKLIEFETKVEAELERLHQL